MKKILKKIFPKKSILTYHWCVAVLANLYYGKPSEKIKVIGVTGTSGKSTTIEIISKILEDAGYKVGALTTIKFKIGKKETLNKQKMTMVGRFQLQKLLSEMVQEKCDYAIVETTSEGIAQFRHVGIHYDTAVITNLYPEHIDSHGSFQNYKAEKLKLFKKLSYDKHKIIDRKKIEKKIIVNLDDQWSSEFLAFDVNKKYGIAFQKRYDVSGVEEVFAKKDKDKQSFVIQRPKAEESRDPSLRPAQRDFVQNDSIRQVNVKLLGNHNLYNCLMAYVVGMSEGINHETMQQSINEIKNIPGRIERIDEGQPFEVIVDYAFEPRAMQKLYEVVSEQKNRKTEKHKNNGTMDKWNNGRRIIQVLGTTGGGRDKARGFTLGKMAGEFCNIVIATNEDPYDDDPKILMNRVVSGAKRAGKQVEKNLFSILNRKKAIKKAIALASSGDVILVTGKGSESTMVVNGRLVEHDDRKIVRELLISRRRTSADI